PKAQEWELLDWQGRLIQKRQWDMRPDFEDTIDIRNLPLGTYLIRVRIENQWLHKKIIKK
ncbi:MAG: T9SS type A sorting domain-containing protein, partial [Runella zeae]